MKVIRVFKLSQLKLKFGQNTRPRMKTPKRHSHSNCEPNIISCNKQLNFPMTLKNTAGEGLSITLLCIDAYICSMFPICFVMSAMLYHCTVLVLHRLDV